MSKSTIKSVNKLLANNDLKMELVKGKGYFYFIGDDVDVSSNGIYVYDVSELTLEQWLEEAKSHKTK